MTTTHAGALLRHLRTFVATENSGGPTDRQLLEQFAAHREEAAFEALVRRHAPLVLAVCRRVLRHEHDAEDAFQATFLVLARKAREVGRQGSVAGWLHRVAYHAAIRAKARTATRRQREHQAPPRQPTDLLAEVTGRELLEVLDEELQHLSDGCRAPLVLCYLQGRTCDDAARQLGWSVRTLKRRLEQGRNCLRARLARRGIALPAALLALGLTRGAKAGVPAKLAALTVQAVLGAAGTRTAAGALAEAVLRGMSATRMKVLGTVLLLGVLVFGTGIVAHQAQAQRPDAAVPAPPAAGAPPAPAQPATPPAKDGDDTKKPAVTGRVLDADGKPVAGAVVAGSGGLDLGELSVQYQAKPLGEVKTDAEGRFTLPIALAPGERVRQVELLAGAKGYGPAWKRLVPAAGNEIELRLPPEEAAVGRLIDLQGEPVPRAKLRPVRVLPDEDTSGAPKIPAAGGNIMPAGVPAPTFPPATGDADAAKRLRDLFRQHLAFAFSKDSPLKDSPLWPAPVTTGADGRFRLAGFGKGQEIHLVVEDDRFARQEIVVKAGAKEQRHSLLPPHRVTGRVVTADTGKPVANAWVGVTSFHEFQGHLADLLTDADGRFAVNAYPGESYNVEVYPQKGEPYLAAFKSANWPKGTVKQEVDFKLPRGVVVRGRVVEAGSGKPIVSAAVAFVPQSQDNPDLPGGIITGRDHRAWTGPDGTFQIVFPPGRGHLIVTGPSADYVYRTVTDGELQSGKPGGRGRYFHAALPAHFRLQDDPKELMIELRRAVTIKGRVVGPDGKPVKDAVVFVPHELLPSQSDRWFQVFGIPRGTTVAAVPARDGSFEVPNCDPDKTYRVFVQSGRANGALEIVGGMSRGGVMRLGGPGAIDAVGVVNQLLLGKDPLGAVGEVSARGDGKPAEIKLAPCESAEVRFVDAKGKAVKQKVWLELVLKPGAETALLASPYSLRGEKSPVEADADGRITIPGLIPGATYRLKVLTGQEGLENETILEKDFTIEAGKITKLELVAPEGK